MKSEPQSPVMAARLARARIVCKEYLFARDRQTHRVVHIVFVKRTIVLMYKCLYSCKRIWSNDFCFGSCRLSGFARKHVSPLPVKFQFTKAGPSPDGIFYPYIFRGIDKNEKSQDTVATHI